MELIDEWLINGGASTDNALQYFDSLEPVGVDFMIGRWKGTEIPTGHQMDGLLSATGWYGKMFIDKENVHPLLFRTSDNKGLYAVNPKHIPLNVNYPKSKALDTLMKIAKPALETHESKARLRMIEYRGKVSAAMAYDEKPIFDCFRKIDENRIIGAMDQKGSLQPYFFMLERDDKTMLELHFM